MAEKSHWWFKCLDCGGYRGCLGDINTAFVTGPPFPCSECGDSRWTICMTPYQEKEHPYIGEWFYRVGYQ